MSITPAVLLLAVVGGAIVHVAPVLGLFGPRRR
jgi:hypothetical protein